MRSRRSFLACAIGSSAAALGSIRPKTASAAPNLTVTMQAEQLAERQRQLGEELLAVFNGEVTDRVDPIRAMKDLGLLRYLPTTTTREGEDEFTERDVRIQAAKALGLLRHLPAIPSLVKHIHLQPLVSEIAFPPAVHALALFGDAAVPELVRTYLNQGITSPYPAPDRQHLILAAIRQGDTITTARTYALGIAAEGDRKTKAMVEYFLEELTARVENRRPLHKTSVLIDARGS